ncbi:spermidine/spermine N(1)-acetyltransferase [Spirosoma knui]
MSVRFSLLTAADAQALSEIAKQSYSQHYLDCWYDRGEWYLERSFAVQQLTNELNDPNARYFMVLLAEKPVGFIKINIDKPLPNQPNNNGLELERIYLLDEATGHGVGRAAVHYVEDITRQRGKQTLWLKAMDTSPAVGFYRHMGFQDHSRLRLNFPQMKEEVRGMIVLQKPL